VGGGGGLVVVAWWEEAWGFVDGCAKKKGKQKQESHARISV
jgi:hypothetical protein